jgi:hypothetical protein
MPRTLLARDDYAEITSGLDWVTLTTPPPLPKDDLLALGEHIFREEVKRGCKSREFRWNGYHGQATEHCAFGVRADSAYLRVSGCLASEQTMPLLSSSGVPTRVDHQTTFTLRRPVTNFGLRILRCTGKRQNHRGARVERSQTIATSGLWIGRLAKRSSKVHVRGYDKGVEAKLAPPGLIWRVESECKQEAARWTWGGLKAATNKSGYSASICRWSLERYGCSWRVPISCESITAPVLAVKRNPEVDRALAYLRKQVQPGVNRLWEAGYQWELLEALGLFGRVRPVDPLQEGEHRGDVS